MSIRVLSSMVRRARPKAASRRAREVRLSDDFGNDRRAADRHDAPADRELARAVTMVRKQVKVSPFASVTSTS
jgi:hypothetical protein